MYPGFIYHNIQTSCLFDNLCYVYRMKLRRALLEDLIWQVEAGADECIGEVPCDRFAETLSKVAEQILNQPVREILNQSGVEPIPQLGQVYSRAQASYKIVEPEVPFLTRNQNSATERVVKIALDSASAAQSVEELRAAVEDFADCSLKNTAINTVFADGNPASKIMFIGDVPGAEEDRSGLPFVGPHGQYLTQMLASIDLDLSEYYITNIVFWRPPGDRDPTTNEISICIPFVERHIELVGPEILVFLGGPASRKFLNTKESINKIRGKWFDYATPKMASSIKAMSLYHPANVVSSPVHKKSTWHDLLEIKKRLG